MEEVRWTTKGVRLVAEGEPPIYLFFSGSDAKYVGCSYGFGATECLLIVENQIRKIDCWESYYWDAATRRHVYTWTFHKPFTGCHDPSSGTLTFTYFDGNIESEKAVWSVDVSSRGEAVSRS